MQNRALALSDVKNYEYGYGLAYKLASEGLGGTEDIKRQCLKGGARYQVIGSRKLITLEYLGSGYQITLPDIEISRVDGKGTVALRDKLLILHYLTRARGTPLSNKLITYKELPEGTVYFPTFAKRAIRPLVDNFGKEPGLLINTAAKLGGRQVDYGDVAVTISAFSRVPVTLVLWRGDEEFPPEGNILFDSTISDYLPTEDISVLCEIIAWQLVRSLKGGR